MELTSPSFGYRVPMIGIEGNEMSDKAEKETQITTFSSLKTQHTHKTPN